MKTPFISTNFGRLATALGIALCCHAALAKDLTAFDLMKEGNRFVGEQSKDKVVQVRSEKSVGALAPNIWHVVYYDPDATLKAVEVKFGGGVKMDVKRPIRLLEPITNREEPLVREKLKIDSDEALRIASKEPVLANLTLRNSRMILERHSTDDNTPVWKVRLWAAKIKNPSESAEIGSVVISAQDGKVLKNDLQPGHAD